MHLDCTAIADPSLRAFLELLRRERLGHIVVAGGAVRDALLSRPIRDIDIAVRLTRTAPARLREPNWAIPGQTVPELWQALAPLARAIGCDVSALAQAVPFHSSSIDVLGLAPVEDADGQAFPDIFVDASGRLFNARPELTVNQIMLSTDGAIGPDAHVRDLVARTAQYAAAPLPMRLRQVLRTIRTAGSLSLHVSLEVSAQMLECVRRVREVGLCQADLAEADARRILTELECMSVGRRVQALPDDTVAFLEELIHDL